MKNNSSKKNLIVLFCMVLQYTFIQPSLVKILNRTEHLLTAPTIFCHELGHLFAAYSLGDLGAQMYLGDVYSKPEPAIIFKLGPLHLLNNFFEHTNLGGIVIRKRQDSLIKEIYISIAGPVAGCFAGATLTKFITNLAITTSYSFLIQPSKNQKTVAYLLPVSLIILASMSAKITYDQIFNLLPTGQTDGQIILKELNVTDEKIKKIANSSLSKVLHSPKTSALMLFSWGLYTLWNIAKKIKQ